MGSWLLGPLDTDGLHTLAAAGADKVVLDFAGLESDGAARDEWRVAAREWLRAQRQQVLAHKRFERWVRIGGVGSGVWREDLAAAMTGAPDGILLGMIDTPGELQEMAALVYEHEQRSGLPLNSVRLAVALGGSPRAALTVEQFADALHPRVDAVTWNTDALARKLGVKRSRKADGSWIDPLARVRASAILVAHAQGLQAVEAACPARMEARVVGMAAKLASNDGCHAMLASTPAHVATIAQGFGVPTAKAGSHEETDGRTLLNVA